MITVFGIEMTSLADAPKAIEVALKNQYRVNDLASLEYDEKISVIKRMDGVGLFSMRNGVNFAAQLLDLSRTTVYKYLNKS